MTEAFRSIALTVCLAQYALAQDDSQVAPTTENGREATGWIASTKEWIESTKRTTGSPPTDREFAERAAEARVTARELSASWKHLATAHQPIVSKQDLIELIEAKRASIHDVRCKYTFQQEKPGEDGSLAVVFHAENSFFRSGAKLRMDSTFWRGNGAEPTTFSICYNGAWVESVDFSLATPNASINRLRGLADYYRTYDVLANAMLLDCDVDLGVLHLRPYDLLEMLNAEETILLQELEEVDGRMCQVATDSLFRVYLDVDRDFSVMRFDTAAWVFDQVHSAVIGYGLNDTRRFESVTDHGNGLWLPHRMETTFLEDGRVVNRQLTEVVEMAVNEGVDDSVFENIIPKGAFVYDSIRGASYRYGEDPSIEGTLGAAVAERAPRARFRWTLVFFNIVAICVIGWQFWRRRASHVR